MTASSVNDDRAAAIRRLPQSYSLALRLRDAGVSGELIAECVGIEPEGVGPLFEVAEAKLDRELGARPGRN